MTTMTISGIIGIGRLAGLAALALLGLAAALIAWPGLEQAVAQDRASSAPAGGGLRALVYVPHDFGAPEVSEAGGVRGLAQLPRVQLPRVQLLAPRTLAATLTDQPTLYWYLSIETPVPVQLLIQDAGDPAGEPVLAVDLPAVAQSGVYALPLADHGIRLETNRSYRWSMVLGTDDQGAAGMAVTILQRVTADAAALTRIDRVPPLDQVEALAAEGYWYDAIHRLSEMIAAGDQSNLWRWYRADLLEQVGLGEVAAYDRSAPK
jgi:hypothetical protein